MPYFATDALVKVVNFKNPDVLASIIGGATSGIMLASGIGLSIALLTFTGTTIW